MLDVNKLRVRCEKFQGKIAEITHSIQAEYFDFCYLIQLSVAIHTSVIPYRSANFNRSLKTVLKTIFLQLKL